MGFLRSLLCRANRSEVKNHYLENCKSEYNSDGYNNDGYDCDGYNRGGFNRDGYDRYGYDCDGYNHDGYNHDGYDHDGYNHDGYDHDGYNHDGYNHDGYNHDGYDHDGYDHDGYDHYGYSYFEQKLKPHYYQNAYQEYLREKKVNNCIIETLITPRVTAYFIMLEEPDGEIKNYMEQYYYKKVSILQIPQKILSPFFYAFAYRSNLCVKKFVPYSILDNYKACFDLRCFVSFISSGFSSCKEKSNPTDFTTDNRWIEGMQLEVKKALEKPEYAEEWIKQIEAENSLILYALTASRVNLGAQNSPDSCYCDLTLGKSVYQNAVEIYRDTDYYGAENTSAKPCWNDERGDYEQSNYCTYFL